MNFETKYPILLAEKLSNGSGKAGVLYLFGATSNKGFQIEGLAAVFVQRFNGDKTLDEITAEIESEFNLQRGEFANEISEMIDDLLKHELIEFAEGPSMQAE